MAAIEMLHADLAAWLGSNAAAEVFERFAAAQHEEFSMVTTSGEVLGRAELLSVLRGARNTQPGLKIDISEVQELAREGDTVVVRFLELHRVCGTESCRRVTAVLVADGAEFRWRTVHETEVST
ncbi:nuclear transport factor 2 family protein [Nocardia sp. GCM10030253]|uniref:nuclear transport factor 2 family protein n=1 Tax=Nocardia sp. GCM10030253 TaxID=3273404 RepID=UPI0036397E2C